MPHILTVWTAPTSVFMDRSRLQANITLVLWDIKYLENTYLNILVYYNVIEGMYVIPDAIFNDCTSATIARCNLCCLKLQLSFYYKHKRSHPWCNLSWLHRYQHRYTRYKKISFPNFDPIDLNTAYRCETVIMS